VIQIINLKSFKLDAGGVSFTMLQSLSIPSGSALYAFFLDDYSKMFVALGMMYIYDFNGVNLTLSQNITTSLSSWTFSMSCSSDGEYVAAGSQY
jgi:hypothetical protein